MERIHICALGELGDGDIRPVEIGDREALIARDGDKVFALSRRCLHQGADLTEGIISRASILCPQHGWRFKLATGQQDVAPQNCLITYAVVVDDGQIYVDPSPRWLGEEPI